MVELMNNCQHCEVEIVATKITNVRDQVKNQVWSQVYWQVKNQVWDNVRDQIENQVWDQVRNQVWDQLET